MIVWSNNEAIKKMARAVSDYDRAENMVYRADGDHIVEGVNTIFSALPADAPAELLPDAAKALTAALAPVRAALKQRALAAMAEALRDLQTEPADDI